VREGRVVPFALDALVPRLALAIDGDPATKVPAIPRA
jgi:hypothetical protein